MFGAPMKRCSALRLMRLSHLDAEAILSSVHVKAHVACS
jgi:hypothetical protein